MVMGTCDKYRPYGAVATHLTCNEKIRGSNPRAGLWMKYILLVNTFPTFIP